MNRILQRPALAALVLLLISWITIRAGIYIGETRIAPGDGYQQKTGISENLFRFDAEYYFNIATNGYSYNGDPGSSPNIVFAPLYPALIWLVSSIPGVNDVLAGFVLNKIFFYLALYFLFLYFSAWLGKPRAFWTLAFMVTAAGAYSFHAYYSESTMLLCLSLMLFAYQKKNWLLMAIATAALGASRLAALPIVIVAAVYLFREARNKMLPLVCLFGSAIYLGYIGVNFGNPFRLLPEIQSVSWGFYHPQDASWLKILTGINLLIYSWEAAIRGPFTLIDIKTLNLLWTLLALASVIYSYRKFGLTFFTAVFAAYFLFIYASSGGSDFLISTHRFYVLMLPIFVMFSASVRNWTLTGLLILANVFYCLLHTAFFNQGTWFYF